MPLASAFAVALIIASASAAGSETAANAIKHAAAGRWATHFRVAFLIRYFSKYVAGLRSEHVFKTI